MLWDFLVIFLENRKHPLTYKTALRSFVKTWLNDNKAMQCNAISFDPTLVGKLKDDHQELLKIYGKIVAAKDNNNYTNMAQLLRDFKFMLQTHLMIENVRFYVYLQQQFVGDPDVVGFVTDVRKEMDGIARSAIKFTNTYAIDSFTDDVKADFAKELNAIGMILVKRIAMEESRLYTLYQ